MARNRRSDSRVGQSRKGSIDEVGEADGWLCWLCDTPVDSDRSVNDDQGPSIDRRVTKAGAKKKSAVAAKPRLAHRMCNTGKGAVAPIVEWGSELFVSDPAPIIASVERLVRKRGREAMARCPTEEDATRAADWLVDRLSRLEPDHRFETLIEPGGGQYLVVLVAV